MSQKKTIINPFSNELQIINDDDDKADKYHSHQIADISGLQIILQILQQGNFTQIRGGYFIQ